MKYSFPILLLFLKFFLANTDRGHFTPEFHPRDIIVDTDVSVLTVLANHTLRRYHTAGVGYIEYSVSSKDLLNPAKLNALTYDHTMQTRLENDSIASTTKSTLQSQKNSSFSSSPPFLAQRSMHHFIANDAWQHFDGDVTPQLACEWLGAMAANLPEMTLFLQNKKNYLSNDDVALPYVLERQRNSMRAQPY